MTCAGRQAKGNVEGTPVGLNRPVSRRPAAVSVHRHQAPQQLSSTYPGYLLHTVLAQISMPTRISPWRLPKGIEHAELENPKCKQIVYHQNEMEQHVNSARLVCRRDVKRLPAGRHLALAVCAAGTARAPTRPWSPCRRNQRCQEHCRRLRATMRRRRAR